MRGSEVIFAQELTLHELFSILNPFAMPAAGYNHTVLLKSDGNAVAFGDNSYGQCDIPPLEAGMSYIQVAAGGCVFIDQWGYRTDGGHTVLLKSDGNAVAFGDNSYGQCDIPPLETGMSYIQVSAGWVHIVLLRSDGSAVAFGHNSCGQCDIPPLEAGMSYIQVSAGGRHTVLLKSDGTAVARGEQCKHGACDIPELEAGLSYTQVSAGSYHTVLLKSDGTAVEWPRPRTFPKLADGTFYTEVSAGTSHTVLLKSDGSAVAAAAPHSYYLARTNPPYCDSAGSCEGECHIPRLEFGEFYMQVSAGHGFTVLLKCDGSAVACGDNSRGQCALQILAKPGARRVRRHIRQRMEQQRQFFVQNPTNGVTLRDSVMLLDFAQDGEDWFILTCSTLSGREILRWTKHHEQRVRILYEQLAHYLHVPNQNLRLVPDGQFLAGLCRANPSLGEVACRRRHT